MPHEGALAAQQGSLRPEPGGGARQLEQRLLVGPVEHHRRCDCPRQHVRVVRQLRRLERAERRPVPRELPGDVGGQRLQVDELGPAAPGVVGGEPLDLGLVVRLARHVREHAEASAADRQDPGPPVGQPLDVAHERCRADLVPRAHPTRSHLVPRPDRQDAEAPLGRVAVLQVVEQLAVPRLEHVQRQPGARPEHRAEREQRDHLARAGSPLPHGPTVPGRLAAGRSRSGPGGVRRRARSRAAFVGWAP